MQGLGAPASPIVLSALHAPSRAASQTLGLTAASPIVGGPSRRLDSPSSPGMLAPPQPWASAAPPGTSPLLHVHAGTTASPHRGAPTHLATPVSHDSLGSPQAVLGADSSPKATGAGLTPPGTARGGRKPARLGPSRLRQQTPVESFRTTKGGASWSDRLHRQGLRHNRSHSTLPAAAGHAAPTDLASGWEPSQDGSFSHASVVLSPTSRANVDARIASPSKQFRSLHHATGAGPRSSPTPTPTSDCLHASPGKAPSLPVL